MAKLNKILDFSYFKFNNEGITLCLLKVIKRLNSDYKIVLLIRSLIRFILVEKNTNLY
jgi:hypothetical protein